MSQSGVLSTDTHSGHLTDLPALRSHFLESLFKIKDVITSQQERSMLHIFAVKASVICLLSLKTLPLLWVPYTGVTEDHLASVIWLPFVHVVSFAQNSLSYNSNTLVHLLPSKFKLFFKTESKCQFLCHLPKPPFLPSPNIH